MQYRGLLELGLLSTVRSKARQLLAASCSLLLAEMDLIFIISLVAPILDLHTSLSASACSCLGERGRNRKDPGKVWRPEQGDRVQLESACCHHALQGSPGFSYSNFSVSETHLAVGACAVLSRNTRFISSSDVMCFLLAFCLAAPPPCLSPASQTRLVGGRGALLSPSACYPR